MKSKNRNPGKLCKVLGGTYIGKYCTAYNVEQTDKYLQQEKLLVRYYEDMLCRIPVKSSKGAGNALGIEKVSNLTLVGFID